MRHFLLPSFLFAAQIATVEAHAPPLLPEKEVAAIANELSGETAKRNLEGLARFHRQRGHRTQGDGRLRREPDPCLDGMRR